MCPSAARSFREIRPDKSGAGRGRDHPIRPSGLPGQKMEDWGMEIVESILLEHDGAAECFCDRLRKTVDWNR